MAGCFEPLTKRHDRSTFRCASAPLKTYFQQIARKHAERHVAAVIGMMHSDALATTVG